MLEKYSLFSTFLLFIEEIGKYSIICLGVVVMLEILDKDIGILKLNIMNNEYVHIK